jgi:SAM-dependent methyltransferase
VQAEFDKLAKNYETWHQEIINSSGFSRDYFYEYKIKEIYRILTKNKIKFPLSILDFGCGIGNVDPYIRKYFPDSVVFGMDISEESIKIAKEKQRASNITYKTLEINWQTSANAKSSLYPAPHTLFDLVFVSNVFHHAPKKEHAAIISYIHACMNPGALLFVFELNPYNPASRVIFNKYDRPYDKNANLIYPKYLKNKMKLFCLQTLLCNYTVFFPKFLSMFIPLEKYINRIPLGAHYYIMAKKMQ